MWDLKVLKLVGLNLLSVLLLWLGWEFFVEDFIWSLINPGYEEKSVQHRWGEVISAPIFAGIALIIPTLVLLRSIAERKRAEEALRESEEALRSFINNMPDSIYMKDMEGRYTLVNDMATKLYRMPKNQLIGKTVYDIHPKSEADATAIQDREVMKQGVPIEAERELTLPDGLKHTMSVVKFPVRGKSGEITGIGGINIDITERKRTEDVIRESEERLRQATELAGLGFRIWDSIEDRCLYCSDENARIYGTTAEDFMARATGLDGALPFVHPEDHDVFRAAFRKLRETGAAIDIEYRVLTADGETRFVREIVRPLLDNQGKVVRELATIRDITERKHAEEARQKQDAQLRQACEIAKLGHWYLDQKNNRLTFSPELAALLRVPHEEVAEITLEDFLERFVHPSDRQMVRTDTELPETEGARYEIEYRVVLGDGETRWVYEVGEAILDETGQHISESGTIQDITTRKRAEEGLARSEERMRDAIESISEGFILYDADDRFVLCNSRYRDFYPSIAGVLKPGVTLEDVSRTAFEAGAIDGSAENVESWMKLRLDQQRMAQGTHEQHLKDGRWLLCSERRTPGGDTVSIRTDITEVKRAEKVVRTRDAWLRAILENAPMHIVLKDTEGRIMAVSKTLLDDRDILANEILGRTTADFLPADVSEIVIAADLRVLETGQPVQQEIAEEADGFIRYHLNAKFPLTDDNDQIIGICTLSTDITDMKLAEEKLRQAQKMDAIGKLTGGVAHDFNNLLSVIQVNLVLLERKIEADKETKEMIDAMRTSATLATDLTRSLLAFSRQQPLAPMALDLEKSITGPASSLLRTLAAGIEIETSFMDGLWPVLMDPYQLENVILNLALNARDAMPGGGRLEIEASNLETDDPTTETASLPTDGQYVKLVVSDNGKGMPDDVIARAFDPFFTTKEVGEGTGLGLSLVYGVINQSGGHIELESKVGEGTRVTMYLPRADDEAAQLVQAPDRAEPVTGGNETILVTEDDEPMRKAAVKVLSCNSSDLI